MEIERRRSQVSFEKSREVRMGIAVIFQNILTDIEEKSGEIIASRTAIEQVVHQDENVWVIEPAGHAQLWEVAEVLAQLNLQEVHPTVWSQVLQVV